MNKYSLSNTAQQISTDNKPHFWQILLSTLAAAFGVQNKKNLEQDFKYGSGKTYIAAGLLFTVLFVFAIILAVKLVLKNSSL